MTALCSPVYNDNDLWEYLGEDGFDYLGNESDTTSDDQTSISNDSSSGTSFASLSNCSSNTAPNMTLSKIPKNDIRRFYTDMFLLAHNGYDVDRFAGFFADFSTNQMTFEQICLPSTPKPPSISDVPNAFQIEGLSSYLQFCFNQNMIVPDMCCRLTDSKIITTRGSKESRIVSTYQMDLTRTLDVKFDAMMPSMGEHMLKLENQLSQTSSKKRKINPTQSTTKQHIYNNKIMDILSASSKLANPVSVTVHGTCTMFLDANKVITKLQYNGNAGYVTILDGETLRPIEVMSC